MYIAFYPVAMCNSVILLVETSDEFVVHLSKLDFRVVYIVLGSHHMAAEVYNFSSANQLKAVEYNF